MNNYEPDNESKIKSFILLGLFGIVAIACAIYLIG